MDWMQKLDADWRSLTAPGRDMRFRQPRSDGTRLHGCPYEKAGWARVWAVGRSDCTPARLSVSCHRLDGKVSEIRCPGPARGSCRATSPGHTSSLPTIY